jgi:coenzyme F420-reducing hydrogenase gamma subunit
MPRRRPKLAVWKFASCDGCQLSLLDCEDELLAVADQLEIAHFPEASRATVRGPYDLSLVEGSVTTPRDAERIHKIRRASRTLVAIGACAVAGGVQALRNFKDVRAFVDLVYAHPDHIETLRTSTAIADHVGVDFELRGCPIDKAQLLELVSAFLVGRKPQIERGSVCLECKRRGTVCIMVARGIPCLGPVTQAGCGALCPAYCRGCFGCFGPQEQPNPDSLTRRVAMLGLSPGAAMRLYRTFNAGAPPFERASRAIEATERDDAQAD